MRLRSLVNGSGSRLANLLLRGAIACFYERRSTHHRLQGNPRRQHNALPDGGHVDLQAKVFLNHRMQALIAIVE